jgi:phage baseplate assembly protein W
MPLERVSQGFKDISASFQSNPLTNDLIALKNASAIARSVRNIVFTYLVKNFLIQILDLALANLYLRIIDPTSAIAIKDEIENSIRNYEPRVI